MQCVAALMDLTKLETEIRTCPSFFQYLALASNKHSDILNIPTTLTVSPVQACP